MTDKLSKKYKAAFLMNLILSFVAIIMIYNLYNAVYEVADISNDNNRYLKRINSAVYPFSGYDYDNDIDLPQR